MPAEALGTPPHPSVQDRGNMRAASFSVLTSKQSSVLLNTRVSLITRSYVRVRVNVCVNVRVCECVCVWLCVCVVCVCVSEVAFIRD